MDIREYNIKSLAYIGDAIYELYIRKYLVYNSREVPSILHKKSIRYVSAKAEEFIVSKMIDEEFLNKEEFDIFKRGRNASTNTIPKNTDLIIYKRSTGFEAIIGMLYLKNNIERLEIFIDKCIELTNERIGTISERRD